MRRSQSRMRRRRRTSDGVRVRDRLTNTDADGADDVEVRARFVVNASGPWFDRVEGALTGDTKRHIRTTKGIHIAVPPMIESAMALESAVDGRLVFAIPWLGYTWIGTTDTDFDDDPVERARGSRGCRLSAAIDAAVFQGPRRAAASISRTPACARW